MLIWSRWKPNLYRPVSIHCRGEEPESVPVSNDCVALFSGGVDSAYSLWRHRAQPGVTRRRRIGRTVFVHGTDVPLENQKLAGLAIGAVKRMSESLNTPLSIVRTNVREFGMDWRDAHGAVLASVLHWFGEVFGAGLLASTLTIGEFDAPWGSHPLTDMLLGSERFRVLDDGIESNRLQKVAALGDWPEAMECLRVCFHSAGDPVNCGECRKCILTKLMFLASGLPLPRTLPGVPTANLILRMRGILPWAEEQMEKILACAEARGLGAESWARALRLRLNAQRGVRLITGMARALGDHARRLGR